VNGLALLAIFLRLNHRGKAAKSGVVPEVQVPAIDTAALQVSAQKAFTAAVDEAAVQFKQDVAGSSGRLSELIVRLTTDVVERELDTYRTELAGARDAALKSFQAMQQTITTKQTELESGLDSEVAARKEDLLKRLDAKLGMAVMTYVVERLGQGVDLGAQRNYLLESLERHKDELKQDLKDVV
jgi:hypothetical protein